MSTEATQASPETSTPVTTTEAPGTPAATSAPAPAAPKQGGLSDPAPAPAPSLDFIPEAYRESGWAKKYTTPDDFFKGIDNMAKLVGQKQVVQGLQVPGEDAKPEDWEKFHQALGRPESADKYELPSDLEVPEGYDLDTVKQNFTNLAHKNGITQKQAAGLFKDFIELEKQNFAQSQNKVALDFGNALKEAFGDKAQENLALAKRGAKALGLADKLDAEGLSAHPLVLKLTAELGKHMGEDILVEEGQTKTSHESLKEEALRIQKSPEYLKGDKEAHRKVSEIYKKLYPN